MHKIDTDTAIDGEFVSGSSSTGQQATKLNASWFNTVQRELSNIVEKAGMSLSKTDDGQVFSAFFKYIKDKGISGIKKAFSFSDESSHKTLNVDASGITFTQDIDSCTVSLNEGSLHFEGSVDFEDGVEGPTEFRDSVKIVGNDQSTNIQLSSGSVTATGMIQGRVGNFTNGLNVFGTTYAFAANGATISTTLELGAGINAQGSIVAGGGAEIGGNISIGGKADIDGNISVGGNANVDGNFVAGGFLGGDYLRMGVYGSRDDLPSLGTSSGCALACYKSGGTYKLCLWAGGNWNDV